MLMAQINHRFTSKVNPWFIPFLGLPHQTKPMVETLEFASLGARITYVFAQLKKAKPSRSQAAIAEKMGFSPQAATKWKDGQIGRDTLRDFAELTGYSLDWLLSGKGEMMAHPDTAPHLDDQYPNETDYALISQYSGAGSCGDGYLNDHIEIRGTLAFKREWLIKKGLNPKSLSVIYSKGDSMWPTLKDGAVLLIDHSQKDLRDGDIYALLRDGETLIKRLFKQWDNSWKISSDNPDKNKYPDNILSARDVSTLSMIGRVVWQGGDL